MSKTAAIVSFVVLGLLVGGCKTSPTLTRSQEQAARVELAEEGVMSPEDAEASRGELRREGRGYETNLAGQPDAAGNTSAPFEEDLSLATREDFLTLVEGGVPDALRNSVEIRNYAFELTRIEELPEVRFDLFNRLGERALTFEVRTLFFREDGTVLDATEWVRATAPPRGTYRYRAMTWSPYAFSEQVQIRLVQEGESSGGRP